MLLCLYALAWASHNNNVWNLFDNWCVFTLDSQKSRQICFYFFSRTVFSSNWAHLILIFNTSKIMIWMRLNGIIVNIDYFTWIKNVDKFVFVRFRRTQNMIWWRSRYLSRALARKIILTDLQLDENSVTIFSFVSNYIFFACPRNAFRWRLLYFDSAAIIHLWRDVKKR